MLQQSTTDKREHILDVAEELFAQSGFDGVSIREITDKAEVRLASVNYYFGTKEKLYFEVLARRAIVVIKDRKKRFEYTNFDGLSRSQAIKAIVIAIVAPLMERVMNGEPGWQHYFSVIANYAAKPLLDDSQAPEMNEFDRYSLDFIEALKLHSSHQDERKAHHAFQFITGASLTIFANNGRLNTLSEGRFKSNEFDKIYQDGIDFIVGGTIKILVSDDD